MSMLNSPMIELLNQMDLLVAKYPSLQDTQVREAMYMVLVRGFVQASPNYRPPYFFWTFNPIANLRVRSAFRRFLSDPNVIDALGATNEDERYQIMKAMVGNPDVASHNGETVDEYFGDFRANGGSRTMHTTPDLRWLFLNP